MKKVLVKFKTKSGKKVEFYAKQKKKTRSHKKRKSVRVGRHVRSNKGKNVNQHVTQNYICMGCSSIKSKRLKRPSDRSIKCTTCGSSMRVRRGIVTG